MNLDLSTFKEVDVSTANRSFNHGLFLSFKGSSFYLSGKAREIIHSNRMKIMYDGNATWAFVGCVDGPCRLHFHSIGFRKHVEEEIGYHLPDRGRLKPVHVDKQQCALFFRFQEVEDDA